MNIIMATIYKVYEGSDVWQVEIANKTKTEYGPILESINGVQVRYAPYAFSNCTNMLKAPAIPNTITDTTGMFYNCTSLQVGSDLSKATSMEHMDYVYQNCSALSYVPAIPSNVLWGPQCLLMVVHP